MTAPVTQFKVYTGASGATESPVGSSATNLNLMGIDAYDSTNTMWLGNLIAEPTQGTNYSFERIWRLYFVSGPFTLIDNILVWQSAGSLNDPNLVYAAGISLLASTPTMQASAVAMSAIPTLLANAINATPAGGISAAPAYTKYIYLQMQVPSSVAVIGDTGTITISIQYDVT